jgi:hypothetical protein
MLNNLYLISYSVCNHSKEKALTFVYLFILFIDLTSNRLE